MHVEGGRGRIAPRSARLPHPVPLCVRVCVFPSPSMCMSLCVRVCVPYVSLSPLYSCCVDVHLSVSLYVRVSLSYLLSLYVPLPLCLSLCVCLSYSFRECVCLFLSPSMCLCVRPPCFPLCVCWKGTHAQGQTHTRGKHREKGTHRGRQGEGHTHVRRQGVAHTQTHRRCRRETSVCLLLHATAQATFSFKIA